MIKEYECKCGYVWLDDRDNACAMCGERSKIVWHKYKILQPETFAKRIE